MPSSIVILQPPGGDLEKLGGSFAEAGGEGAEVRYVGAAEDLCQAVSSGSGCDLAVVDYFLGDGDVGGGEIISNLRDIDPDLPIIAVAESGDVETAATAVERGATDFLVRGGRLNERVSTLMGKIRKLIRLIAGNRSLREQNRRLREADLIRYQIVGKSPKMLELIDRIKRVATVPRPVLIVGERGTGKELVARAIHSAGGGPDRAIVTVNCAAFTDTLLESELFGHEKGSFTGAESMARGKFETAGGGTLFLDEIGNMSLGFQQKILRVVEYGAFTRVGGSEELKTDARIIAATNADLAAKIAAGEFLQDLYDRLSFEVIDVPSLRDRVGDVEVLAQYFLEQFMGEIPAFRGKVLAQSALKSLREYSFPGNVRELKNIIERAAYRDVTNEITPEDIGMLASAPPGSATGGFEQRVEAFRRGLIAEALESSGGNQAAAARSLGLSYHQFRYYHKKFAE